MPLGYDPRPRARPRCPWRSITMREISWRSGAIAVASLLLWPETGHAQMHHQHPAASDTTAHHTSGPAQHEHVGMTHDMGGMVMGEMPMNGLYGPYAMSREASGTAWQPEAAQHEGVHGMR